jgi:hypothetical protein
MSIWLSLARLAAVGNTALLVVIGGIWLRNYLDYGARHTFVLLVFAGFLFLENLLWLYVYLVQSDVIGWYIATTTTVQVSLMLLCGLEFLALAAMTVNATR